MRRLISALQNVRERLLAWLRRARAAFRAFWASPAGKRAARAAAGAALVAVVSTLAYAEARPTLRLVNTSNHPITVRIDGARYVFVPSTSSETAGGGVVVRLSPGAHVLGVEATAPGEPIADRLGSLSTYGHYLFAAVSTDQCFFVERTAYGLGKLSGPPVEALDPAARLWALPRNVDAVFSPNPPPLPGDRWSTGGERVALRQRRCDFPQ